MYLENGTFENEWKFEGDQEFSKNKCNIVFIFGETDEIVLDKHFLYIKSRYPNAIIVGNSSGGNILGASLKDEKIVTSAIEFEGSYVKLSSVNIDEYSDMKILTNDMIEPLIDNELKHILILSDGLNVNGSELVKFSKLTTKNRFSITGGLAGDGDRFLHSFVIANKKASSKIVCAVGFYGENIDIKSGCCAGWEEFGAERRVTKSDKNIVYEIDYKPAYDLYKKYLGVLAKDLPRSCLRFPLSIRKNKNEKPIIRSMLNMNEKDKSLIFAGDIEKNSFCRLMKTNIDGLIDGAENAAKMAFDSRNEKKLVIVISCIGRKLVLDQLVDEELEIVQEIMGENATLCGFYSYGEIAPFEDKVYDCRLHNQTITLTVISEKSCA